VVAAASTSSSSMMMMMMMIYHVSSDLFGSIRRGRRGKYTPKIVGRVHDFAYVTPNGPGQMIVHCRVMVVVMAVVVTHRALDGNRLEDLLQPTRSALARSGSRAAFFFARV
jgi:hypothetical protein